VRRFHIDLRTKKGAEAILYTDYTLQLEMATNWHLQSAASGLY
jgi:hypothetical protein